MASTTQKILRFGVFELNLDAEELRKSGTLIKLAPQPLHLLALLASRAGQTVTREEIKERIWGEETYVDFEQGMNQCVKQIRTALSDNADNPLYVETLPRRGYRFLAPVVSKNVLAPEPKIIKSQSGVQSGVIPALEPDGALISPKIDDAPPRGEVAAIRERSVAEGKVTAKDEPIPASDGLHFGPAQAAGHAEGTRPRREVTSTTTALVLEIARLRESSNRTRRILIWTVVTVAALVAAILYWQLRTP